MESYKLYNELNETSLNEILDNYIPQNSIILDKDKIIIQFLSYCSLENDFNFILDAVSTLVNFRLEEREKFHNENKYIDTNLTIKRSLFTSIITTYAKCFNSSNVNGRTNLNADFIKKNFQEDLLNLNEFLKFHEKIINMRNTYIAHSDKNLFEKDICYMNFNYNNERGFLEIEINYISGGTYNFDEDEFQLLILLCSHLKKNVVEKKTIISDKIIKNYSKEQLIELGLTTIKKS